jgi:Recombination endonuclease VII
MRRIDVLRIERMLEPDKFRSTRLRGKVPPRADDVAYSPHYRATPQGKLVTARSALKAVHGITLGQYEEAFKRQRGLCAICNRQMVMGYTPEAQGSGQRGPKPDTAHVDHDHGCCPGRKSCGRCFRGLLCGKCNTGLACFLDKVGLLVKAMQYIARTGLDNRPEIR